MGLLKKLRRKYFPTPVEQDLETRTSLVIENLCYTMNIAMPQQLPTIDFDANAGANSYNTRLNHIAYDKESPDEDTIYEESGHFLHNMMRAQEERRVDIIRAVFTSVLAEAIGYCCSCFSGQRRTAGLEGADESITRWEEERDKHREQAVKKTDDFIVQLNEHYAGLADAKARIAAWQKEKALKLLGIVAWYAADAHSNEREVIATMTPEGLYNACLRFFERNGSDATPLRQCSSENRRSPVVEKIISVGGWTEILPEEYRDLPATLDMLIEKHTDELINVTHIAGYELGRMLHRHYRERPEDALAILRQSMRAPESAAFQTTIALYRTLTRAGQTTYLPLKTENPGDAAKSA